MERASDFDAQIVRRHAQVDIVIAQGDDGAAQPAAGDDAVSGLQLAQHRLPFLLSPLLRKDQQEVEDDENKDQREPHQYASAGGALPLQGQSHHVRCQNVPISSRATFAAGCYGHCSAATLACNRRALGPVLSPLYEQVCACAA